MSVFNFSIIVFVITGVVIWLIGFMLVDKYGNFRLTPKVSFKFVWFDLWIGFFYDSKKKWLYIIPFPTLCIIIKFNQFK